MTTITFVESADIPADTATEGRVVVLDEAWSSAADDLGSVPIHRLMGGALVEADGLAQGIRRIDAWADAVGIVDALTIDGVPWWFRIREAVVGWLHERLIWLAVIEGLRRSGPIDVVRIPMAHAALIDVARGSGLDVRIAESQPPLGAGTPRAPSFGGAALARLVARFTRPAVAPPTSRPPRATSLHPSTMAELDERIARLGAEPRIMILTNTGIQERVERAGAGPHFADPLLGPVIDRLRSDGERPIVVALGLDHRDGDRWKVAQRDPDLVPGSILANRWRGMEDGDSGVEEALGRLPGPDAPPLAVGDCDLSVAVRAEIERLFRSTVLTSIRQVPRIGRLIDELRPRAILLTHEGIRTPWLIAARRAGVPIQAVQHGMIYPTHAGYRRPRIAGWPSPDTMYVFGPYERDVLVEVGGYLPSEVVVSGSPRFDSSPSSPDPGERESIRAELGVRAGDRLLLVSTSFSTLGRKYMLNALRVVLGGPLPGVHLVFKQHPGETDDGPYQALVEGMAAAGGWTPPAMSVVRGRDLYALLRAADAHLGYVSTVLTDAVATATPNLIADVAPPVDVLGYVAAGVAIPIGSPEALLAALANGRAMDGPARTAFLERHFADGDATARIVDGLRRTAELGTLR